MATLFPDIKRLFDGIEGKKPKYLPMQIIEEFRAYIEDLKANQITIDTVYVAQNVNGEENNTGRRQRRMQNSPRPPRIEDFVTRWLGMSRSWWYELPKGKKGAAYAAVIERITEYCYNVKFGGATVGIYNAAIIARELGLKESMEITGKDGKDILQQKTDEELDREIEELKRKLD